MQKNELKVAEITMLQSSKGIVLLTNSILVLKKGLKNMKSEQSTKRVVVSDLVEFYLDINIDPYGKGKIMAVVSSNIFGDKYDPDPDYSDDEQFPKFDLEECFIEAINRRSLGDGSDKEMLKSDHDRIALFIKKMSDHLSAFKIIVPDGND